MMWRGIGRYICAHPETPVLFGPVSISRAYNRTSRQLLCRYFQAQRGNPLSQWIKPKRPFRSGPGSGLELGAIKYLLDLEERSSSTSEIDGYGEPPPLRLRQQLGRGARLLSLSLVKSTLYAYA